MRIVIEGLSCIMYFAHDGLVDVFLSLVVFFELIIHFLAQPSLSVSSFVFAFLVHRVDEDEQQADISCLQEVSTSLFVSL